MVIHCSMWNQILLIELILLFRSPKIEMTTTTVHRGITYDVTVNGIIPLSSLSLETVFSCSMEIPGTQFSLKKETMYMHRTLGVKNSQVSGGSECIAGSVIFWGLIIWQAVLFLLLY